MARFEAGPDAESDSEVDHRHEHFGARFHSRRRHAGLAGRPGKLSHSIEQTSLIFGFCLDLSLVMFTSICAWGVCL